MKHASVWSLVKEGFDKDKMIPFLKEAVEESRTDKWNAAGLHHSDWNRYAATYYGRNVVNQNKFAKRPRENAVFKVIESQKYTLIDNIPFPEFLPRDDQRDIEDAFILNHMSKLVWDVSNYQEMWSKFIHHLLIYGTGIMKVSWDQDLFGTNGMVSYQAVDPRTVFISPGASSISEAVYVIESSAIDIDIVKSMYPEHADEIDAMIIAEAKDKGMGVLSIIGDAIRNIGSRFNKSTSGLPDEDMNRKVEVVSAYITIPKSASLPDTSLESSGVWNTVVVGGKLVVRNEPLKYTHGRMPFIAAQSRYYSDRVWGVSDIEIVESLQQELDRINDKRSVYNELSYFPYMIVPEGSGAQVRAENFVQRPNPIVRPTLAAANAIRFLSPPPVGRHIQYRRDEIMAEMKEEIGTGQISEEILKKNIAPTTISQVREALEAPVRYKLRMMEPAMRELAFQTVSLMQQYFTGEIIAKVAGLDGMQSEVIPFERIESIRDIDETRFNIRTGVPSNSPLSRAFRSEQMIRLAQIAFNPQLPIEAREVILEAGDFPNFQDFVMKERRKQTLMEQLQLFQLEAQVQQIEAMAAGLGPQAEPQATPTPVQPEEQAVAPAPPPSPPTEEML